MKHTITAGLILLFCLHAAVAGEFHVYFGTYTGAKSKGIYVSRFDSKTGKLSESQLVAETRNPSFLAVSPNERYLYSVAEVSDAQGKRGGAVNAYAIEGKTGQLTALNQQTSGGAVGSSRVDLQACKLEYSIVSPK